MSLLYLHDIVTAYCFTTARKLRKPMRGRAPMSASSYDTKKYEAAAASIMYTVTYDSVDLTMMAVIGEGADRVVLGHDACVGIDWCGLAHGDIGGAAASGAKVTVGPKNIYFTTACECGCGHKRINSIAAAEFPPIAAGIGRAVAMRASVTVWN